jgi:hypothetical protein
MTRSKPLLFMARWWSIYTLYICVVSAAGFSALQFGAQLTRKFAVATSQSADNNPRPLSRVERQLNDRARWAARTAALRTEEMVVAIAAPDIHPVELAAALDRAEQPDLNADAVRLAASDCTAGSCTGVAVQGWSAVATAKGAAKVNARKQRSASKQGLLANARSPAQNAQLTAFSVQNSKSNSSPKQVFSGKMALQPSQLTVAALDLEAGSSTFKGATTSNRTRTPGEIIRISLLGSN